MKEVMNLPSSDPCRWATCAAFLMLCIQKLQLKIPQGLKQGTYVKIKLYFISFFGGEIELKFKKDTVRTNIEHNCLKLFLFVLL